MSDRFCYDGKRCEQSGCEDWRGCRRWLGEPTLKQQVEDLTRQLSEAREAGERDRRDALRYRVLRLYTLHSATWDEKRHPGSPGLLGWSGACAGKPYSETVIDAMMDELISSKWTLNHCPAIAAAIAAAKKEG